MVAARRNYILTETAERDFRAARNWSMSRWGAEQTQQYFMDLHQSAEALAERYSDRQLISDVGELGIHPVREHYLVYVPVSNNRIVIVALIRQTRDVPAILNANGFNIRRQLKAIMKQFKT